MEFASHTLRHRDVRTSKWGVDGFAERCWKASTATENSAENGAACAAAAPAPPPASAAAAGWMRRALMSAKQRMNYYLPNEKRR
jgi:hypothetical protein